MPIDRGLMKAYLADLPTLVPKIGLQGSGVLRRIRRPFAVGARRVVGYSVLFTEPGTEIDEAAAFAAEGAINRLRRPFHRPFAGGTFNDRCHR
jgi:hypothetical protein